MVDGSGPMGQAKYRWDLYPSRFGLTPSGLTKGGTRENRSFHRHLLVMAHSSMWSALALIFCSAHVGTGSETTVGQESQHFPRITGRPGAADAAVDSARAEVPLGKLRAGRIRRMAMLEYTT